MRDGVLSDRQSFYLANETEREPDEVAEEFMLQYYGGQASIPALLVVQRELGGPRGAGRRAVRPPRGPGRAEGGRAGREEAVLELAERNALLALDQEQLRTERRREGRVQALEGLQEALGLEAPPIRIECFDISNLGGTHTVASMVVFEGGAPKKSDYRRFTIRTAAGTSDDYAAMAEVLSRRFAQLERQLDISPHDTEYDASFAALPNLVVIDGGRGQLSAGMEPLSGFRERGVAVISLAKRIEEVFIPGRRTPLVLDHRTPELQLLQRVRDEAHRFAITHHRSRRDRAMTSSLLDELRGSGPRESARCWPISDRPTPCSGLERAAAVGPRGAREARARPACLPAPRGLSGNYSARVRVARHNRSDGSLRVHGAAQAGDGDDDSQEPSRLADLVVITGFSGAGKSTAMNVFEDAGYFCVDNLPPEMIRSLVELFVHKGSKVERAAVVSDVRGGVYFEALREVVEELDAIGLRHHLLFLEASEQTLVTRYKETRRRHPLAPRAASRPGCPPSASCSSRCARSPTS